MKSPSIELYTINKNVYCLKCGHKGVIQSYGTWGFGGTIPWECTNCDNVGLIDFGGLEGYKQAFISIEKTEKLIIDTFSKFDEVTLINQKDKRIYVYYQALKYDREIVEKLINAEMDLEDTISLIHIYDIHFVAQAVLDINEEIQNNFKCLYKNLK